MIKVKIKKLNGDKEELLKEINLTVLLKEQKTIKIDGKKYLIKEIIGDTILVVDSIRKAFW